MKVADLDVERCRVDVNGISMFYVTKGSGPLCVLLHGFPETWWSFRHQIAALAAAGYRVVAPDLRGYGESGKDGPYDIDTLADDVRALIRAVGDSRALVVGHDWGGAVAWHFARRHPAAVVRLAVINCPHPALMAKALTGDRQQMARSWYMFFFLVPWLPERVLTAFDAAMVARAIRRLALRREHLTAEDLAPYREAIQRPGAASAMLGYYRTRIRALLSEKRGGGRVEPIVAETLLIWGVGDRAFGVDVATRGLERYVPRVTVELLEGVGHFAHEEAPEAVNSLLLRHFAVVNGTPHDRSGDFATGRNEV